jgi:hypothetical protein
MKSSRSQVPLAPVVLAALLLLPGDGTAADAPVVIFSKLADNSGAFHSFDPFTMAINAHGHVAVRVTFDDASEALVRFDGQTMTTIASTPSFGSFGGGIGIDDTGSVTFDGRLDGESIGGVYAGNGGSLTIVAPAPVELGVDPMYSLLSLDSSGLALMAKHSPTLLGQVEALVVGTGGPIITVFDQALLPADDLPTGGVFASADLGDNGDLAFVAGPMIGMRWYVYRTTLSGTPLVRVASPNLTDPYNPDFRSLATNDSGTVALIEGVWGGYQGVYAGTDEASLALIASTDDPYAFFGNGGAAINASGMVVFQAMLDGYGEGIFTGPDPDADKLIATGDPLDGSVVTTYVQTNRFCLNGAGEVAFAVGLEDGRAALFLGQPAIFVDGFESGNTSQWSVTVPPV